MKKIIFKKTSFIFALSLALFLVFTGTNTYAATVGERLNAPEEGWQRFDDLNAGIVKENGDWATYVSRSESYKGGYYISTAAGATISFTFEGTKFRVMSPKHVYQSKDISVIVDGVEIGKYSAYSSSVSWQTVVFEKVGLTHGTHTVKLVNNDAGKELSADSIDIDDAGKLIGSDSSIDLKANGGNSQVTLSWNEIKNATGYKVNYGTEPGKYSNTISVTKDAYKNYVIPNLTNGETYYFQVISVVNGVEKVISNEALATPNEPVTEQPGTEEPTKPEPEQPSGNRAILVVTMTTGLEKEFDLSTKEVDDFIDWYEAKQAGSGKASYAIDKHDNNKGPFSSRKDYILYDRVLTFEVSEYK